MEERISGTEKDIKEMKTASMKIINLKVPETKHPRNVIHQEKSKPTNMRNEDMRLLLVACLLIEPRTTYPGMVPPPWAGSSPSVTN